MNILILIVLHVIIPVFILIGIGALLHRKFQFDMNTLSKLTTYMLMSAVGFIHVYESDIVSELLFAVLGFLLLQNLCLIVCCTVTIVIYFSEILF